ncbi:hypothetical protein SDRG_04644 [Saprolegnia diclina VS20]|uniref:Uncharacterized protein n=1 Tax=Saprolegnia diclina (strain VS20) TaxID=1156394 RepID=T0S660_SAPDV|nr:hypothetical protein SDRG_04644 [Saprolegnia diclina VS20]EQC38217.1 hypothetical protein SDRG_04644 [Saprolegnia diclina VS20]|eukprot:XP_008608544.1 hypothetical protein SDRG_04644 [Saprolegnia diclina VS20]
MFGGRRRRSERDFHHFKSMPSVEAKFVTSYECRLPIDLSFGEIQNAISLLKGRRAYLQERHGQIATAFAADDLPSPHSESSNSPPKTYEFARLFHGNIVPQC